jgi:hypothetical protein
LIADSALNADQKKEKKRLRFIKNAKYRKLKQPNKTREGREKAKQKRKEEEMKKVHI